MNMTYPKSNMEKTSIAYKVRVNAASTSALPFWRLRLFVITSLSLSLRRSPGSEIRKPDVGFIVQGDSSEVRHNLEIPNGNRHAVRRSGREARRELNVRCCEP